MIDPLPRRRREVYRIFLPFGSLLRSALYTRALFHDQESADMSDSSSRVQEVHDEWAEAYDSNENPTRDLRAPNKTTFEFRAATWTALDVALHRRIL